MVEARMDLQDADLKDSAEDKTSDKNELKDEIDGLPSEDDIDLEKDKKSEQKVDRSEVAQKIKYREKLEKANERIAALESEIAVKKEAGKDTGADEKTLAANKYIREQAREAFREEEAERQREQQSILDRFNDKVDQILEDNSDITEDDLLSVIEDYSVEPEIALKILQRTAGKSGKDDRGGKRVPTPRGGSAGGGEKKKVDDSNKSMHQIAQEVVQEFAQNKK